MSVLRTTSEATIAISGTTSDTITVPSGKKLVGFITPGALDGSAFTFKGAVNADDTPINVYNGGTAYSVNVGTSRYVAVDPNVFLGLSYIKIVSGSTETAARTITLVFASE